MIDVLVGVAVGFGLGIFIEWKYGSKLSSDNAAIHDKLDSVIESLSPPGK